MRPNGRHGRRPAANLYKKGEVLFEEDGNGKQQKLVLSYDVTPVHAVAPELPCT